MDIIESLKTKAVIQHGPLSDRIYLMDLGNCYINRTIKQLNKLGEEKGYGKIFAKVPEWVKEKFEEDGYVCEAEIPRFYNEEIACSFMCKYLKKERKKNSETAKTKEIIKLAKSKKKSDPLPDLQKSYILEQFEEKDAQQISKLYSKVFDSYPFPLNDPKYIKKTMKDDFDYFGIIKDKKIISVASSGTYPLQKNVEMTGFATDPSALGKNLSFFILKEMEYAMHSKGLKTWFTIARSMSPGMNITFARSGYKFGGTLINNTNICGQIENMNVWYKHAPKKKKTKKRFFQ